LRVVPHLVEGQHPGAELERLLEVVGDHEDGHSGLAPQPQHQRVHVVADAGVEGAERLVEQQDARLDDQRLGDRQPLLHPARERRGQGIPHVAEADGLERRLSLLEGQPAGPAEQEAGAPTAEEFETQDHVADHREVGEDRVALEDDAPVGRRLGRQVLAGNPDRAGGWLVLAEEEA